VTLPRQFAAYAKEMQSQLVDAFSGDAASDLESLIAMVAWQHATIAMQSELDWLRDFDAVFGSPIERLLFYATLLVSRDALCDVAVIAGGDTVTVAGSPCAFRGSIELQAQIDGYLADMLLTVRSSICVDVEPVRIVLECDGHDFHERTKEQASRDKKRDREMQQMGFTVFRYSGSDIFRDPFKAAKEAVYFGTATIRAREGA